MVLLTILILNLNPKKNKKASIVINKEAPSLKYNGVVLFRNFLPIVLPVGRKTRKKWFGEEQKLQKLWDNKSAVRLVTDGYRYWLNFPVKVEHKKGQGSSKVALDPGICCFQTTYSTKEVALCHESRWELILKLRKRLDGLRRARSEKKITR